MTTPHGYYEVLGVSPSADSDTIHRAFRQLSKTLHPDTTRLPAEEAAKQFHVLCEAYGYLADPHKRQLYDLTLQNDSEVKLDRMSGSVPKSRFVKGRAKKVSTLRPLSGGELFSLILLCGAFLLSLLLVLVLQFAQGRELQIRPSWLMVDDVLGTTNLLIISDVDVATLYNSFK